MARLTVAVRSYRFDLMLGLMRKQGYDALGFSTAEWFEWAGNQPLAELAWERPSLLLITASGRAFAFMSEQSRYGVQADLVARNIWIDEVTFFSEWPDSGRKWLLQQWPEMVADVLATEGLGRARIGVDSFNDGLRETAKRLPGIEFTSVGAELSNLRWIKHADEIKIMRQALDLSDWIMQQYRDELLPGRLLDELQYTMSARLSVEAARRFPGEHFSITRLSTKSGATAARIKGDRSPTGRVIERNKVAVTDLVTRLNSMTTELTRPFLLGRDSQMARLFDGARAAQEAAAEEAIVGAPIRQMHRAAQRVIQQVAEREHFSDWLQIRMGHPIGMAMHEHPSDTTVNERPLLEHELYSIEPGIYVADVGAYRFADPYWVGLSGPEQISTTRKDRDWYTLDG